VRTGNNIRFAAVQRWCHAAGAVCALAVVARAKTLRIAAAAGARKGARRPAPGDQRRPSAPIAMRAVIIAAAVPAGVLRPSAAGEGWDDAAVQAAPWRCHTATRAGAAQDLHRRGRQDAGGAALAPPAPLNGGGSWHAACTGLCR
jgi:hypothetical protein